MTRRRTTAFAAVSVLTLSGLVGCADDRPPSESGTTIASPNVEGECGAAIDSIVSAAERYVTTFHGEPAPEALDDAQFRAVLADAQEELRQAGCDPSRARSDLERRLGRITTEGPVADAVLRQLIATTTDAAGAEPTTISAGPDEDLRDTVARAPDGSTVKLEAGEYRLDGSLVLLAGVEIRGAGRDATTIISTAPEASVLALTGRRVELASLTVRHEGAEPASVVLGGVAASVVVTDTRLTGGNADSEGQGGAGILMFDPAEEAAGRGTTLEVTDTELVGNDTAGVVLLGAHRTSIVGSTFELNGDCGICFHGATDGSVEDSTFAGNRIGIVVTGTAMPSFLRVLIEGGEVGLQASDAAAPAVDTATISATTGPAIVYTGTAAGGLDNVICKDVPIGIVVGPDVRPRVGEIDCEFASTQ